MNQPANSPSGRSRGFRRAVPSLLGLILLGVILANAFAKGPPKFKLFDYIEYDAAARLWLRGDDPYNPEALIALQSFADGDTKHALMMWNPPWVFPVVGPLGLANPYWGYLGWLLLQLGATLLAVKWLWEISGDRSRIWLGWGLAITFAPTLFLLMMGQISGLILLGYCGFAHCIARRRFAWAGVFGWLAAFKPHYGVLFVITILFGLIHDRRYWRTIAAGFAMLLVASLIPMILRPSIWFDYFAAMRRPPSEILQTMDQFEHPTIGYRIRQAIPGEPFRAQFLPLLVAMPLWAFVMRRFLKRRPFAEILPLMLGLTCLTACYGAWAFDLVLLLPLVIDGAKRLQRCDRRIVIGAALAYLLVNGAILLTIAQPASQANPWITPVVLAGWIMTAILGRRHPSPWEDRTALDPGDRHPKDRPEA